MTDSQFKFYPYLLLISAIILLSFGVSYADLIEPKLPERHFITSVTKEELPTLPLLTNPDLPDREGVEITKLKVHSAAKVMEQYDSNVFLANSDRNFDFITVLSPSVGFDAKLGDNRLSADYEISQYLYGIWHDQDHLDQRVRVAGEAKLTDYKLAINDEFNIFTDRAANENSLRLMEKNNDFKADLSAQFNKFGFDTGYINKLRTYASKDLMMGNLTYADRDRMDQSVYATLSYRFWPKTYLILENDLGYINYYETSQFPDSFYEDVLFGIRGEWTSKTVVNLRIGERYQHYDKSNIISSKPYIGPIVKGGLEYSCTKNDKILLILERADYESTYATNNYYTMNFISTDYKHKFGDKLSSDLFAYYQLDLYPTQTTENGVTAKRYDNIFGGGVSLRYDIRKWLSIELRYDLRDRLSRFDIFNFIDNIIMLRGTIGF